MAKLLPFASVPQIDTIQPDTSSRRTPKAGTATSGNCSSIDLFGKKAYLKRYFFYKGDRYKLGELVRKAGDMNLVAT